LRKRGFNQSLVLARQISKKFSIPLNFTSLKRIVDTPPQIGMGKSQRASNVKNAFKVADKGNVKGKKILLVDDVYTTGSTVNECARTLLRNGAEEVAVLTLARA
jgi:ComF family protein